MAYLAGDPQSTVSRTLCEGAATSGQNVIPIPGGFTPGMVDVFVGGACLSFGDYDDTDGMSIKLTLAMSAGTQFRVVIFSPVSGVSAAAPAQGAQLIYVVPLAGATSIPFPHTVGCAWLIQRGVLLQGGQDYTEDSSGFYLSTITADGVEAFGILSVSPVTFANVLFSTNPVIKQGPLTFADGTIQASSANTNRNFIVDGNFDAWTGGATALTGAGAYSPGCMYYYSAGGGSGYCTISKITLSNYSTFGGLTQPATNGHRMQQTAVGNTTPWFTQRIEGVRTLSGKSATFSCWLWTSDGNTYTINKVVAQQQFGSGGSSSVLLDPTVNWVVGPTPKRFSIRLDLPSVVGKTFGTANTDFLHIGLYFPNITYDIATAQWQLEESSPNGSSDINGNGGTPTEFEWRGVFLETARVQRFIQAIASPGRMWGAVTGPGTVDFHYYPPVTFRITPAMSLINTGTGAFMESMPFMTAITGTFAFMAAHACPTCFDFELSIANPSPAITVGWPATWTGGVIFDARF